MGKPINSAKSTDGFKPLFQRFKACQRNAFNYS